jgi:hypothetical protein
VLRLYSRQTAEPEPVPEVEPPPEFEQLALDVGQDDEDERVDCRKVTEFSEKARNRMAYRLATLDWSEVPGILEMLTLTYPRECPLDGLVVKRHLRAFAERYRRRWGVRPVGAWKLEFQKRGAPHFHIYQGRPIGPVAEFQAWLSLAWANVVRAEGYSPWCEQGKWESAVDALARVQARFPSRADGGTTMYGNHLAAGTGLDRDFVAAARSVHKLSVYFAKHNGKFGLKGYQNEVPEGFSDVGRFWGVWGLKPRVEDVEVTSDDFDDVRRILAGYRRSTGARYSHRKVARSTVKTGEVGCKSRWVTRRKRVRYCGRGGLVALCGNGPAMAVQLGLNLSVGDTERARDGDGGTDGAGPCGVRVGFRLPPAQLLERRRKAEAVTGRDGRGRSPSGRPAIPVPVDG